MSSPHDTSDPPSLPPLELSSYPEFTLAPPPPISPGNASPHILRSPAPSVAESYSTAYTSTSPPGESEINLLGSYSLAPPQSLRKSISVDSFVQYNRDDHLSNNALEPVRSPIYGLSIDTQLAPVIPTWLSRSRGESLSSIQQDQEPSFPLERDLDRSDNIHQPAIERVRLQSLKTPESPISPERGGDLRLPSRTSTTTAPNHAERGHVPSVSSTSSLQSSSRGGSTYVTQPAARLRSGSLGYNMPSKRSILSQQTQLVNAFVSKNNSDIVVVVIGTSGCGKSTVVKRGLSSYGLVKSEVGLPEPSMANGILRYTRRISKFINDQQTGPPGGPPHKIEVIEVEVQKTGANPLIWPQEFRPVDGVIICYDASDRSSYLPVDSLLRAHRTTALPVMVLGCKSDLDREIEPYYAMKAVKLYDTGLIEVSHADESGKAKMKRSFEYLLKAILRQRGPNRIVDNRNPATPDLLRSGAAEDSWTKSPTSPSSVPMTVITNGSNPSEPSPSTPTADSTSPTSPNEQTSSEHHVQSNDGPSTQSDSQEADIHDFDDHHNDSADNSPEIPQEPPQRPRDDKKGKKEPRPSQWANLEDLLDKLLFLAVSGDDPTFATHFLLTYRRFTTPRYVLLAMQKRMRSLDHPSGDPMFACFAQMRICHLLETWIHDYAHDFTVAGTTGALHALIKSIISKTHLLHYGPELLSFLEQLPYLVDEDSAWAKQPEVSDVDSDDYTPEDEDEDGPRHKQTESSESASVEASGSSPKIPFPLRERKASLPLSRALLSAQFGSSGNHASIQDQPKQYIKDLVKLANDVLNTDSDEIAQEITRQGVDLFMAIKPRDWLNFTFISKKKPNEPITKFNLVSNHLADWVVSLILCHERPRNRARQIEKFVDIGMKLRTLNNYSALRAFVAGINNANDDATMESFKTKVPEQAKNLRSWDLLLQQVRAHRAYRLALRNSKGSCIPAMEVHISDLIKAHEGNEDTNPAFPSKIHWGKFNMMGRFVTTTIHCQNQCRNSNDYNFPPRPHIEALLRRCDVMTNEMQKSRLKSQDDTEDIHPGGAPPPQTKEYRRMFFW